MIQEEILSNIKKLPDYYLKEVLHFSEFLLSKFSQSKENISTSRGGYGARRGDYVMSDDFDEPLEDFKEYMQ